MAGLELYFNNVTNLIPFSVAVELMRGHQSSAPSASACRALGAVFRSGPLPLPVGGEGRGTSAEGSGTSAEGSGLSKAGLVASLAEMIKKAGDKQTKVC